MEVIKLIYISHPFGGLQRNRDNARMITSTLACEYPQQFVFINPLDLFRAQGMVIEEDNLILTQALNVMERCDGVLFCDGWKNSNGCRAERQIANNLTLPCWFGLDSFRQANPAGRYAR